MRNKLDGDLTFNDLMLFANFLLLISILIALNEMTAYESLCHKHVLGDEKTVIIDSSRHTITVQCGVDNGKG